MLDRIYELAARMPAGLPDPAAVDKLLKERQEFLEAESFEEQLEEAVDRAYYALKEVYNAASEVDISVAQLLAALMAKLELRTIPGGSKDKVAERAAMVAAIQPGND
jgi:hypothetical protein